ncbi:hypothetical protein GCM10010406_47990 [Streptomyces thermolineatus]|uniref:Uncharacterized protein n=1 Tax=Streptomyces thermolineatus TaxID=44033 RepID=A0ABN3MQN4_9ACTN
MSGMTLRVYRRTPDGREVEIVSKRTVLGTEVEAAPRWEECSCWLCRRKQSLDGSPSGVGDGRPAQGTENVGGSAL